MFHGAQNFSSKEEAQLDLRRTYFLETDTYVM